MSNELISRLSMLKIQKSSLKRNLDKNYYDAKIRTRMFDKIKEVDNEIEKTKFLLKLEKEKKNDIKY